MPVKKLIHEIMSIKNQFKKRLFSVIFFLGLLIFLNSCSRPIAAFHWNLKERAFVKKTAKLKNSYGYPKHSVLSSIICFDINCRKKVEWKKNQKKRKFRGFGKKNNNKDAEKNKNKIRMNERTF